jgi:hypothetical protein
MDAGTKLIPRNVLQYVFLRQIDKCIQAFDIIIAKAVLDEIDLMSSFNFLLQVLQHLTQI